MVTEKLTTTHQLLDELSRISGKNNLLSANRIGEALQFLEQHGIPNTRSEDYKYCNTEAIIRKEFLKLTGKEISIDIHAAASTCHFEHCYNLYSLNGLIFHSEPDLNENIIIHPVSADDLIEDERFVIPSGKSRTDAFTALNTIYADRGFFIRIKKGSCLEKPIVIHTLLKTEGPCLINSRNRVLFEEGCSATLVEINYPAEGKIFLNNFTRLSVMKTARVKHFLVQNQGDAGYFVNRNSCEVMNKGSYTNFTFTLSGSLVRNNLDISLSECFSSSHLFGLFVTNGNQLVDNHTIVDHLMPDCESNELYKGIASGKSTAIFNGQIFVERNAQKTNAYQSSKNILLSDQASVFAKPELEIYANDVKCSHGTSTGKIDENALFYLKSRGIGDVNARKLLLRAFAHEVVSKIDEKNIALFVENLFDHSLSLH